ncbi:uncharacterized protein LOC134098316 [Sardina pilchardus]|uniref:uncharacterized protein LOC134098316 n=1 Tax=Sardina pilchardus TaxID=27697 RepID=UPI002E13B99F
MDITAAVFLCLLSCIPTQLTGQELKRTVVPGGHITLNCSTKSAIGSLAVWIKLGSDQPPQYITQDYVKDQTRLKLIKSDVNNDCYNLLITNITTSDACVYIDGYTMQANSSYFLGHTRTKVTFAASSSPQPSAPPPPDHGQCWVLMVSMCVVCTGLSALTASICVYCFCSRTGPESQSQHHHVKIAGSGYQREQFIFLLRSAKLHPNPAYRTRDKEDCGSRRKYHPELLYKE